MLEVGGEVGRHLNISIVLKRAIKSFQLSSKAPGSSALSKLKSSHNFHATPDKLPSRFKIASPYRFEKRNHFLVVNQDPLPSFAVSRQGAIK